MNKSYIRLSTNFQCLCTRMYTYIRATGIDMFIQQSRALRGAYALKQ